jgi:hypothetical protein
MRNKKSRFFSLILLSVLFFFTLYSVSWALVPAGIAIAIVLRTAGGVVISHVVRNQFVYNLLGATVTSAAILHLTYDRGTSVDPAKRYVNVPLTESTAAVTSMKGSLPPSSVVWASGTEEYRVPAGCADAPGCSVYIRSIPSGSIFCVYNSSGQTFKRYDSVATVFTYSVTGQIFYPDWPKFCDVSQRGAYVITEIQDKIYNNLDLLKYYQISLGRDLSKAGIVESASPASNSTIVNVGGDVYETDNYTDARSHIENAIASETPLSETDVLTDPPISSGTCGEYQYRNNWGKIKTDISSAINILPLYGLINKLADLTGQSGFPHQYTLDLSSVGLGRPSLDLDAWHFAEVLAVLRWAILAGSFILAWRIAVGGD